METSGNRATWQDSPNRLSLRLVEAEGTPLRECGDETLMLMHGQGSEEAFSELVRRHQKGVLNYMYRMVHNRHVAEELTQEVFLAIVRHAQQYEPTAKFTTYLYTIASRIGNKEWMRNKQRHGFLNFLAPWKKDDDTNEIEEVGDVNACVETNYQRTEITEAVNEALQKLPETHREAFVLLRFHELSYDEIAKITNTPVGTLKARVVRAERALRPLLKEYLEYIE